MGSNKQSSRLESMQSLLEDWHKSGYEIKDRLILAVKNKDVAALNHGVRQYLKLEGKLSGVEIEVSGNHYMKGDRILIQKTNKELGVVNGDLGQLLEIRKDKFVVVMNSSDNTNEPKIIEFDPSRYSGFRHGYATTVFKAQGASIKDVYVFHDGFSGLRNAYVALSRQEIELKLYINNETTPTVSHLVKQLSYDPEMGSSLNFYTKEGSETYKQNTHTLANMSRLDSMLLKSYDFAVKEFTKLTDKYLPSFEYYNYQEPKQKTATVSEVIDKIYEQNQNIGFEGEVYEQKLAVGGGNYNVPSNIDKIEAKLDSNNISNTINNHKASLSAKSKFYAKVDYTRNKLQKEQQKVTWSSDNEKLRSEARYHAERIAKELLGEPNKTLSNGKELRFGEHGRIAIRISGSKSGTWYDFASDKGGDMFDLVQEVKGCDFKTAVSYLQDALGISRESYLIGIENDRVLSKYASYGTSKENTQESEQKAVGRDNELKQKELKLEGLIARSRSIGDRSIARKYLSEHRGIDCALSDDIRTAGMYVPELKKNFPALLAFARNEHGDITGGCQILLDSVSNNKADVAVPKKSFGKISGSFVEIARQRDVSINKVTIIAEGLETAASIKQVGIDANIVCSLGVGNIKNYPAVEGEYIIIAADNDGRGSSSEKAIEKAVEVLSEKAAVVKVVEPKELGDFNDILMQKDRALAVKEIREGFEQPLKFLRAESINELGLSVDLQEQEKILIEHNIDQRGVIHALRVSADLGVIKLNDTLNNIQLIDKSFEGSSYDKLITETASLSGEKQKLELTLLKEELKQESLQKLHSGTDTNSKLAEQDIASFIEQKRDIVLKQLIEDKTVEFAQQKRAISDLPTILELTRQEQEYFGKICQSHKEAVESAYTSSSQERIKLESSANTELVNDCMNKAIRLVNNKIVTQTKMVGYLQSNSNIGSIHRDLTVELDTHEISKQLRELTDKKVQTLDAVEYIKRTRAENEYLANVKVSKDYVEHYDSGRLAHINYSHEVHNSGILSQLEHVTKHLIENKAITNDDAYNKLRNSCCSGSTAEVKELKDAFTSRAYEHHINIMNKNIEQIKTFGDVTARGKSFASITGYIIYEMKHPSHEFVDMKRLEKGLATFKEYEQQKQLEKQHQLDHHKHMGF